MIMTQEISQKAIDACKGNMKVTGRLMALFNKHQYTIERWYESKSALLTTPDALKIILEETGLAKEKVLITPKEKVS